MTPSNTDLDPTRIFDSIEFPHAYKVSYLANAIVIPTYEDVLRDFGILRPEYHLLMTLAHYPALASIDIAELTRMPRNSISRAVKRMEDEGYITRAEDPTDRRKSKLRVTDSGRAMHERIAAYLVDREAEVFEILSEKERHSFEETLQKLAVHASKLDR
ncbi:MAG: MarR family transcriptional regulator [Pseudomonadota bacterium]